MERRYIEKLEMTLSPLGMGVLRFAMPGGTFDKKVYEMLGECVEGGINYFDTAYFYIGGHSETLLRDAVVRRYPRDVFHIADKLALHFLDNKTPEEIFQSQLERLGIEYIDIYLLQALNKDVYFKHRQNGIREFLSEKKREGRVRKIGFSFHDSAENIDAILDDYPWDVVYLQINWFDWEAQNTKYAYEALEKRGIPCIVMEPLRGGLLAVPPTQLQELFKKANPSASAASWGLRFAASLPDVAVVLSGMVDIDMLRENISTFSPLLPLSSEEYTVIDEAVKAMKEHQVVPCTGCNYCFTKCPRAVTIPAIMAEAAYTDNTRIRRDCIEEASKCISCGRCSEVCPQRLDVPKEIKGIVRKIFCEADPKISEAFEKRNAGSSTIVCFGAGSWAKQLLACIRLLGYSIDYFCDNSSKNGVSCNGIPIINPKELKEIYDARDTLVIITVMEPYASEIRNQLNGLGIESTDFIP